MTPHLAMLWTHSSISGTAGKYGNMPKSKLAGKTILVFDSSRHRLGAVREFLSSQDCTLLEARNETACIEAFRSGSRPDIVVIGLKADDTECMAFLKSIRNTASRRFTPILLLVSEEMIGKMADWQQAGATAWVVDPFTRQKLLDVCEMLSF